MAATGALAGYPQWTSRRSWLLTGTAVLSLVVPALALSWLGLVGVWGVLMVLMVVFIAVAGDGLTGRFWGALIDERNKMSLARFQMVVWTVLLLSAFLAAGVRNIAVAAAAGTVSADAILRSLNIAIPQELWAALGISVTSLVGSPLILATKKNKEADPKEFAQTAAALRSQEGIADPDHDGQVLTKDSPQDARFVDLFKGEETGNAAFLDLAKVQMFYLTLILAFVYAVALGTMFRMIDAGTSIGSFPALNPSLIALLTLSHAGYLANKAIPHSQTSGDASGDVGEPATVLNLTPSSGQPVFDGANDPGKALKVAILGTAFGTEKGQILFDGKPLDVPVLDGGAGWTPTRITFAFPKQRPDGTNWTPGQTVQIGLNVGGQPSTNALPFTITAQGPV